MLITLESLIYTENEIPCLQDELGIEFEVFDTMNECFDVFNELNACESAKVVVETVEIESSLKLEQICTQCVCCLKKAVGKIVEFFKSVGRFLKDAALLIIDKVLSMFKKSNNKCLPNKAQYLLENIDNGLATETVLKFHELSEVQKENIKDAIIKLEGALVELCNSGKSGAAYMAAIAENNNSKFIELVAKEVVDKNDAMKKCIETLATSFEKSKTDPEQATNIIKDNIYGTGYGKEATADNTLDYKEDFFNGTSDAMIHFNSTMKISANTFEEIFIYWAGKACGITTDYIHPKNIHANLSKILKNYSESSIPNNVIEHASKLRKIINSFLAENSKNIGVLTKINSELQSGKIDGVSNVNYRRFFNIGLRYVQGSEMVMYKINAGLAKYYSNLSNYITMITDTINSIDLPERMIA